MSAGDKTTTFMIDDAGNPEPVILDGWARNNVRIYENAKAATSGFLVYRCRPGQTAAQALASVTPVSKAAGDEYVFDDASSYSPGQTIAYVAAISGTMTMAQETN